MEFADIDPEDVTVGPRHRSVNEAKVKALAESMHQIGVQQPISVWCPTDAECYLVAGLHRLRAAILLKWGLIPYISVELEEADRQLWEIDENLCRSELTPSEIAEHTVARKKLWDGKKAGGSTCATSLSDGRPAGP
jgi:ParB/RepB/Spo0J family partition protein